MNNCIQALCLFRYSTGEFSLIIFLLNYVHFVFLLSSFNLRNRSSFLYICWMLTMQLSRWENSRHWTQFFLVNVDPAFFLFWEMPVLILAPGAEVYSAPVDFCSFLHVFKVHWKMLTLVTFPNPLEVLGYTRAFSIQVASYFLRIACSPPKSF